MRLACTHRLWLDLSDVGDPRPDGGISEDRGFRHMDQHHAADLKPILKEQEKSQKAGERA